MRVFLKAYINNNLGDDLFLKILTERYADEFIINLSKNYSTMLNIITSKKYTFFNKIIKFISLKKINLDYIFAKKYKITILIGGSMFMEKKKNVNVDNFLLNSNNFYIIGANFGPYITQKYYNNYHNIFSKANDVCFREKYSYKLFDDLPNVRMASDIVFSLNTSNIDIKKTNRVIISIIDCDKKIDTKFTSKYNNLIKKLIYKFLEFGYNVTLMSFCKKEGDEKAIENIMLTLSDEQLKFVDKYYYNGNINEALNIIGSSAIVVGSRFHANILGLIMDKTVIPIAYSDKTLNMLNDISFKGKFFDVRNIDENMIDSIDQDDLNYKLDVSFFKKDAERHFEELDKILKKRGS